VGVLHSAGEGGLIQINTVFSFKILGVLCSGGKTKVHNYCNNKDLQEYYIIYKYRHFLIDHITRFWYNKYRYALNRTGFRVSPVRNPVSNGTKVAALNQKRFRARQ
jgi:hypothetical protein